MMQQINILTYKLVFKILFSIFCNLYENKNLAEAVIKQWAPQGEPAHFSLLQSENYDSTDPNPSCSAGSICVAWAWRDMFLMSTTLDFRCNRSQKHKYATIFSIILSQHYTAINLPGSGCHPVCLPGWNRGVENTGTQDRGQSWVSIYGIML